MRQGAFAAMLVMATVAIDDWAAAQSRDDDLRAMVERLGADSYAVRDQAERTLIEGGLAAQAHLMTARNSPDAEVRYRARRILDHVVGIDFQMRLTAFIRDDKGRFEHNLAGWRQYRELAGNTAASRRLFAEMQLAEAPFLQAIESKPTDAEFEMKACCDRVHEMISHYEPGMPRAAQLPHVASLFLTGARSDVAISSELAIMVGNLTIQPVVHAEIVTGDEASPMRRLLAAWVARNPGDDARSTKTNMMLALRFEMREGLAAAVALAQDASVAPQIKQYALILIAKYGDTSHVPLAEALLDDATLFQTRPVGGGELSTQLRDVALAALVLITKQPPKEYGLDSLPANNVTIFNSTSIGFLSDEDRHAAHAKWRAWRAAHPPVTP